MPLLLETHAYAVFSRKDTDIKIVFIPAVVV
jgi:hypothetical protein